MTISTAVIRMSGKWAGWIVTLCGLVQFFLLFGLLYNYSIMFVSFREEFQTSAALTGWIGSLENGSVSFFDPLGGVLLQWLSCRSLCMLTVTVFSLGCVGTSFIPNIYWAFLTMGVMMGFGAGANIHSVTCLLLDWFPGKNNARATCLSLMGTSIGFLAFAPLKTRLIAYYGWRSMMRIIGGGVFVFGILSAVLLVPPPCHEEEDPAETGLKGSQMKGEDKEQSQDTVDKATDVFCDDRNGTMEQEDRHEECIATATTTTTATDTITTDTTTATTTATDTTTDTTTATTTATTTDTSTDTSTDTGTDTATTTATTTTTGTTTDTATDTATGTDTDTTSVELDVKSTGKDKESVPGKKRLSEMVRQLDVWLFMLSEMFSMTGWTFVIINFASFMKNLGFTPDQTSLAVTVFSVAEIAGKILTAWLGDHLPFLRINVVTISSMFGAIAAGFLTLATSLTHILILSMVCGVLRALCLGIAFAASFELFSVYGRDAVTSVVMIPFGLGPLIGAPLTGFLFDISGSYTLSLVVLGGVFALSSACMLAITLRRKIATLPDCGRRTRPRKNEDAAQNAKARGEDLPTMAGTENKAYVVTEN